MAKAKKQRKYKSPKTILRKTLEFFRANPDNWTSGKPHVEHSAADGGVAHCAAGACFAFADSQKLGNTAIRYLAEALGMEDAQTCNLGDAKGYVFENNGGPGGKQVVLDALESAVACGCTT